MGSYIASPFSVVWEKKKRKPRERVIQSVVWVVKRAKQGSKSEKKGACSEVSEISRVFGQKKRSGQVVQGIPMWGKLEECKAGSTEKSKERE